MADARSGGLGGSVVAASAPTPAHECDGRSGDIALRRTRATAWQISAALQMPRSTVTRVLARVGLNRVALVEPRPVSGTNGRTSATCSTSI